MAPIAAPVPALTVRRLMIYFGLVYFAQGIGQAGALISQPLMYYLKSLGMTTDQVAGLLAVLTVPWIIKPAYGLLSDFIPLFGYRRKSYLFLMNGLAASGFLWLTDLTAPNMIVVALFLTALGIASSDVLVDALMVENGQKSGLIKQFQSQQWMWFNIAAIISGLVPASAMLRKSASCSGVQRLLGPVIRSCSWPSAPARPAGGWLRSGRADHPAWQPRCRHSLSFEAIGE